MRLSIPAAFLPAMLAACASSPDFDPGAAADAPFPEILPINQIQAAVPAPVGDEGIAALAAKAAALRARANELRGTEIVSGEAEKDLLDAVDTP